MQKPRNGVYHPYIRIRIDEDTVITITKVHYYRGMKQTMYEPEEPENIEVLEAEYDDGSPAEDFENFLTEEHYEEIEEAFKEDVLHF